MKEILITGISSDIGGVLARLLARDASTKIIGTMRGRFDEGCSLGDNVSVVADCDLTRPEDCARVARTVEKQFEGPFGFVHSVGNFWNHVPLIEYSPMEAERMFASHVRTLYTVMHALIPIMQTRGGGSSIAFSCNSVRYNYPWMTAFTAAKSAVESMMRTFAHEFSGDNLRFNSLVLASVKTEKVVASKPRGDVRHFIPPEDLVPVIRFLLSAGAYLVNGSTLNLFVHSDRFYNEGYFGRIGL